MPILSEDRRVQNAKAAYRNRYVCIQRNKFTANNNTLKLFSSIAFCEINVL